MREYALVLLVTAAVTYLLVPLVRRVAVGTRAMHEPRARDVHTEPTPLLGGLAMYGGMVVGLIIASRLTYLQDPFSAAGSRTEAGLLLAGGLIVLIGFIDDRWGLSAISKLAGQVAAAGILVWSGQALPWLPTPNGHVFSLEPDLSVTLTILLVVVTINAINFIDGLDGLAAGIVGIAALSFLVYSYTLVRTLNDTAQSLPAVSSALLAGMCLGFLPHNFYPARIFMGDIGAALLGLLLAYGPISSTNSLDSALLSNYAQNHPVNRFGTILPLLVPAAIFLIPYTDLMFAVIRRTRRGKPVMAADREHLHHRLLGIGHSYRQSVLIMWLWAALFSVTVVSLSLVRSRLWVLEVATVVAVLTLLPVTMPRLRPWRLFGHAADIETSRKARRPAPVASSPAASPAALNRVAPAAAFAPMSSHGSGHGARAARNAGAVGPARKGGPPPGFEPIIAPPAAYDGNGSAGYPGNGNGNGNGPSVAPGTSDNDSAASRPGAPGVPGNGSVANAAAGSGTAAAGSGIPGPGPAERVLRPFPGDADRVARHRARPEPSATFPVPDVSGANDAEAPFPRPGRLPGDSQFPSDGQLSGDGPFRGDGQLSGDGPFSGNGQVPADGRFQDGEDRFADTDPFPASPGRGPRPS